MTIDHLEMSPTFINYCNMAEPPAQLDVNYMQNLEHQQAIRNFHVPIQENGLFFQTSTPPIRSASNSSQNSVGSERKKLPGLFKTSICMNWLASGKCRYNERCWYAHGQVELKQLESGSKPEVVPPKYADPTPMNNATQAQQRWISMSAQMRSEADPNRFARESIAAQFRAGVEARMKDDKERSRISQTVEQNNYVNSFTHHPDPVLPISLPDLDSKKLPEDAAAILHSLTFIKIGDEFTNLKEEACPLYSSAGFCPLGDDCFLEHKVHNP